MRVLTIKNHAQQQFKGRAGLLGVDGSLDKLKRLLSIAKPEKANGKTARFELFKRRVLYGSRTRFLTAGGWRFVVVGDTLITAERVRSHENFKR